VDERDRDHLDAQDDDAEALDEDAAEKPMISSQPAWPMMAPELAIAVNTVLSQFTPDMFFIAFGQVIPPYFPRGRPREEIENQLQTLPVNVVARIAVSPQRMLDMIRALEDNYDRWAVLHGGPPREVQQ
jgi:hypothetical protein